MGIASALAPRRTLSAVVAALLVASVTGCGLMHEVFGIGQGNVFDLSTGDCFNDDSGDAVTNVVLVDCAEPHFFEVTKVITMSGAAIPSDEVMSERVDTECAVAFYEYTGQTYNLAGQLQYTAYVPSRESWVGGDRLLQCLIFDLEGKVTGSLKQVGR